MSTAQPIVYVDRSEVAGGKLEELRAALADLAAFVEANEPGLVAYLVDFDESGRWVSVLHVHRDAASLDTHLAVAGPRFPRFAGLMNLASIDVYGTPSADAVEGLRRKIALLGHGTLRIHTPHAGFLRAPEP